MQKFIYSNITFVKCIYLCNQVETLREKIISLELSNAEDEIESITGTGASDAESESEEITVQPPTMTTLQERNETIISTNEGATPKISANTVLVSKKKKRKRSKKGRH